MIPSGSTKGERVFQGQVMGQQGDEGKQAQQGRAGAQNSILRPLTLSFKAQMGAHFFESDLNGPTADNPGQDLEWTGTLVGGKESGGSKFAGWVAHQDPTDRQWVMTRGVPQGRASGNFKGTLASAIPSYLMGFPNGGWGTQATFEGRLTWPLLGLLTAFAFGLRQRVVVQDRIQAQARDESDAHAVRSAMQPQFDRCQPSIHDQDQYPIGQPVSYYQEQLPNPVNAGFVPSALGLIRLSTGRQHCQERQRPDPSTEGHFDQQHQAHPAQPVAMHNPLFARTYCIPKQSFGDNTVAIASLQCLVGSQHHCPAQTHKRHNQQSQQDLTDFQAIPLRPRQHAMIVLKLRFIAQAHYSQGRAYRPLVRRQDRSNHQHFDPFKHALAEHWRKHLQQRHNLGWQDKHGISFVVIGTSSAYPVAFFSSTKWIKSSTQAVPESVPE